MYKNIFFSLFLKKNKNIIYLIQPVYDFSITDPVLQCNDCKHILPLVDKYIKIDYEPIKIYLFQPVHMCTISIFPKKKVLLNYSHVVELDIINEFNSNFDLVLTTLFKFNKKEEIIFFLNYYRLQGVQYFYLYYNGLLCDLDIDIYTYLKSQNDITLIEWNFIYFLPTSFPFKHHAQLGQIHDALYRYRTNYMVFCDMDEFMCMRNGKKLIEEILESKKEEYQFCNYLIKEKYELTNKIFPLEKKMNPFRVRSKVIIHCSFVSLMNIHYVYKYKKKNYPISLSKSNILFHLSNK